MPWLSASGCRSSTGRGGMLGSVGAGRTGSTDTPEACIRTNCGWVSALRRVVADRLQASENTSSRQKAPSVASGNTVQSCPQPRRIASENTTVALPKTAAGGPQPATHRPLPAITHAHGSFPAYLCYPLYGIKAACGGVSVAESVEQLACPPGRSPLAVHGMGCNAYVLAARSLTVTTGDTSTCAHSYISRGVCRFRRRAVGLRRRAVSYVLSVSRLVGQKDAGMTIRSYAAGC